MDEEYERILDEYNVRLIKNLPMKDAVFFSKLSRAGLLSSGNLKAEVRAESTSADAATHFLHEAIKSLEDLKELVEVMQKSGFRELKKIATEMEQEINKSSPWINESK